MARTKIDVTYEHRITLGKFERTELKQSLDLMQKRQQNQLYKEYAIGAATGAAALGTAYAIYQMPKVISEIGALFGSVYAYANNAIDSAQESAGDALDSMTKPSGAGNVSYWGALIHRLNPLVSAVEWDIRHNSDEQFQEAYGMSKAEYIMYAPADKKPNPDNYCNGMYNCGIPEQQAHYEKYGNGFGL